MDALGQELMKEYYEVTVEEHLDGDWAEWFEGMTITYNARGETILSGQLVDQAALHGVLLKVRDLGLKLVAVKDANHPT